MKEIEVNYKVLDVDDANGCMLIEYSSEGRETLQVSVRIPWEGENLEKVIRSYAPINIWQMKEYSKIKVEKGLSGTFTGSI